MGSAESPVGTVTISATKHNCFPVSTTFTKNITTTDTIDFSAHVSDEETDDANLTIKLKSLPTKGVLTVSAGNAVTETPYAISAITYTSNAAQCATAYTESFTYSVTDASSAESLVGTVNISATKHNCVPESTTFTKTITTTDTIDFTTHVSDEETGDANLTIKLKSLPTKGVLTVSAGNAVTETPYA